MNNILSNDKENIHKITRQTQSFAAKVLEEIDSRPAGKSPFSNERITLPESGLGFEKVFEIFKEKYEPGFFGSAGPRYFGYVTGGATPAALAGDWLASTFDQFVIGHDESSAEQLEQETLGFLKTLFGLDDAFNGSFVTGATMSGFVGIAIGRQWIARHYGVNAAQDGLHQIPPIPILSGNLHSSVYKILSMLGIGKAQVRNIPILNNANEDREAIDIAQLENALIELDGTPCIVIANAGTVNSVDFDDIASIAKLKTKYSFWLHVDAAFGGFAACSPKYAHLLNGINEADSIEIDLHKWLNVPYDSAIQFTKHQQLQVEVFQNGPSAYLDDVSDKISFISLTPENSRRLRALPAWFSLMAYGKTGYQEIVERNVALTKLLGEKLTASAYFELIAPVRLNVVCFTLSKHPDKTGKFLAELTKAGKVLCTSTVYKGKPGIRAALVNWRTEHEDIDIAFTSMEETAKEVIR